MRKKILHLIMFMGLIIITACGNQNVSNENNDDMQETDTVVIGVYGGDWEKNIREIAIDPFSEETNINVEVVAGADAEWYTKLQAANGKNPPYDILILSPSTIQRGVSNDLLVPLTTE